jgi:hypothetical protein
MIADRITVVLFDREDAKNYIAAQNGGACVIALTPSASEVISSVGGAVWGGLQVIFRY